ncbi:MAG: OadG family transporter subunit [Lachnospiraceae bacterium]|nr:OadG family transporter subunit [Lachnospiraceae bacterium]
MKNRIKAIILATGLTVSMLCTSVSAAEAVTEATTAEAATEEAAATEAAKEAAAEEAGTEAAGDTAADDASAEAAGAYAQYYDSMKTSVASTLQALSDMTDEQLNTYINNSDSPVEAAMAANWSNVKEDLGKFVEVTDQQVSEEDNEITIVNTVKYDGVADNTTVTVDYTYDVKANTASLNWNVDYPMSVLMEQAALNTLMGLGIVFLMLLFLSVVIAQLHWIPDLLGRKEKEKQAALAAAPAPAPVAAPVAEAEEDLTDDMELVAVISAAIAASENTSADGFVVRSIKKSNRRKWQNA